MKRADYAEYVKSRAKDAGCSDSEQVAVVGLALSRKRRAVARELNLSQAGVLALEQAAAVKMRQWADLAIQARGWVREYGDDGNAGLLRLIDNGQATNPPTPTFGVEPSTGELQRSCYRAAYPSPALLAL